MHHPLLLLIAAFGLATASARATITYDFFTDAGTFDGQTSASVTLTDPGTGWSTLMTATALGGTLNSNSGDFGVEGSEVGEVNDFIDGTVESITLTFDRDIEIVALDFSAIGSDASDGARVTVGGVGRDLFTGASDFDGTFDLYAPATPLSLSSGEAMVFTGTSSTSSYTIETIRITVIPEPSSLLLLGFACLALPGMLRVRRK